MHYLRDPVSLAIWWGSRERIDTRLVRLVNSRLRNPFPFLHSIRPVGDLDASHPIREWYLAFLLVSSLYLPFRWVLFCLVSQGLRCRNLFYAFERT